MRILLEKDSHRFFRTIEARENARPRATRTCRAGDFVYCDLCQYFVPGWNDTALRARGSEGAADGRIDAAAAPRWPSFTRVNHAKYIVPAGGPPHCALITDHIVSERRVNVGTSNWAWGYFRATFTRQPAPRSTRTTRRSSRRPRARLNLIESRRTPCLLFLCESTVSTL